MSFEISGLKELHKKLESLSKGAETIDGKQNIPFPELFSPEFLATCSQFASIEELFEASGFKVESMEDFAAIPDEEWESFISSKTNHESWFAMQQAALALWTKKKLGL